MKKTIIFLFFNFYLFSEENIESLLKEMQKAQDRISTIQAEFYQKKDSRLFKSPQELSGIIYFKKPSCIRWEYKNPENYIIFVDGEKFQIYYPSLKKVKVGKISRLRGRIFSILFAQEPLEKLKNYFILELRRKEKEDYLILFPQVFKLKKYWKSWTLVINKTNFLPLSIDIVEKDGDKTYVEFKNLIIDVPLKDEIFKFEIPQGVTVENYTKSFE